MEIGYQSDVLYSICSGYNYYLKTDKKFTPVWNNVSGGNNNINYNVVIHAQSDEEYYITDIPVSVIKTMDLNEWKGIICNQPRNQYFVWPVDVILSGYDSNNNAIYSLVFPYPRKSFSSDNIINFIDYIEGEDYRFLDEEQKNGIIKSFLEAWSSFYSLGYTFHEFTKNRLFINKESKEIFCDFSFLIRKADGLFDPREYISSFLYPEYNDMFFYYQGGNGDVTDTMNEFSAMLDLASDYFCISIFIFKMMIGVLPYEGKHISYITRNYAEELAIWRQNYVSHPIFIFDEEDDDNRLSVSSESEKYQHRWESLPDSVRTMFCHIFKQSNALRKQNDIYCCTPDEWKTILFG